MRNILRCVIANFLIFGAAAVANSQIGSPAPIQPATALEVGKSVEREFRSGETHIYEVRLDALQFIKAVVLQGSNDLRITLFDAEGKRVVILDERLRGNESFFWIARSNGTYRIEVDSRRRCDPLFKSYCSNLYEIGLTELRSATTVDFTRVEAQSETDEAKGTVPLYEQTAKAREDRINKLKKAKLLWATSAEHAKEALVLEGLALEYWSLRDTPSMIKSYLDAASLWRLAKDHIGESHSLSLLGSAYQRTGDMQSALESYRQALTIRTANGDVTGEHESLYSLGSFYSVINEPSRAIFYYNKALIETRAIGSGNFGALTGIARSYDLLGDTQKAREFRVLALNEILSASYERTDPRRIVGLARIYGELGEFRKQAEQYELEIEGAVARKNKFDEMAAVSNAGRAYFGAGEHSKALAYLERSVTLLTFFDRQDLLVRDLETIGDIQTASGNLDSALDSYLRARTLQKNIATPENIAGTLHRLAKSYRLLGNMQQARKYGEELISIIESLRAKITSPNIRRSYYSARQNYYEFYLDLLMQSHDLSPKDGYDALAIDLKERARARSLLDLLGEDKIDPQIQDPELLQRERSARTELNGAAEAQSRLLALKQTSAQAAAAEQRLNDAISAYEEIINQIRARDPRYDALLQPKPLSVSEIQRDLLDKDTVLLEYALGDERSYFWLVTQTSIRSYRLPNRSEVEGLAKRAYELLQSGRPWNKNRSLGPDYWEAAERLSQMLIGPVAEQVKGKRLVIVADGALQYIPFSALPNPRSSGQSPRSKTSEESSAVPLAMTNEILSLPSASVLAVLRKEAASRKKKGEGIAVVADPVFAETDERLAKSAATREPPENTTDLSLLALERAFSFNAKENKAFGIPRLPFTRREAESIFASAPKGTSIKALDFDADREKLLKADLSKYRFVHFATHGILHSEHPDLSGIVLSLVNQKGEPVNGFLRLNEIYNINLNADLVVLSACQTALGKDIRGEGLIGLTRGFMYAGSPRVVASLWKVDDVATAELMKIFYQKMLKEKMRPAAALRAAKVAMYKTKRWNAPYYWAAFELQGEWR